MKNFFLSLYLSSNKDKILDNVKEEMLRSNFYAM